MALGKQTERQVTASQELEELKKDNKMYFDLGKSRLFYGLGKVEDKDKFIKYTNKERKTNLRTLQHKYNIDKFNKDLKTNDAFPITKMPRIRKERQERLLEQSDSKE